MDSFDDLLRPGRSVLDDNPFANPFSNRPNSPDPWAPAFASSLTDGSPSPPPSPRSQGTPEPSVTPAPVMVSPSPPPASRPSDEFAPAKDHTASINGPDHSIAGLSPREDSEDAGWQADQKAWLGNLDDDSDDDKPIGQMLKLPEHTSVSVWVSCRRDSIDRLIHPSPVLLRLSEMIITYHPSSWSALTIPRRLVILYARSQCILSTPEQVIVFL